jgi:hypothetical protein
MIKIFGVHTPRLGKRLYLGWMGKNYEKINYNSSSI